MRYGVAGLTYLDNNGRPLAGGKLYFYETGTSTAKATYSDAAETIPNTNPVELDAAGRQPDIFFSGLAKVVITDSDGVQIDVADPVGESSTAEAFTDWVVTVEYGVGDTTTSPTGKYYYSITSGNVGNNPDISPTHWQELKFLYAYNAAYSYAINDVALSAGTLYVSLVGTNLANTPATSPTQWKPLNVEVWPDLTVRTSNFNAATGRHYLLNTSGGAFTMTLPASPSAGDKVGFTDYGGQFGTFNLTMDRNGSSIMNLAENLTCDISYFSATLLFTVGRGWILT